MRLNTFQKAAFVSAVMQDVPRDADEVVKKEIQAALVKAMSPAVRRIYHANPKALAAEHVSDVLDRSYLRVVIGDADYHAVSKPWREKKEQRRAAKKALESVVKGCTTLKQLKDALPDLQKYMPDAPIATANLPVATGITESLKSLGWPKGGSK